MEYFLIHILPYVVFGAALGALQGMQNARISRLQARFERFKDYDYDYLKAQIKDFPSFKYEYIKRDELIIHTSCLKERISILETILEERTKKGEKNENI